MSAAVALGILITAAGAHAQSAVDQYVPSVTPDRAPANGTGGAALGAGTASETPPAPDGPGKVRAKQARSTAEADSSGTGEVPGTDYPLSTFAFIALAAVLVALLARAAVEVRRRSKLGIGR